MRVIGGTYRGRRLRTIGGQTVRPTSDRLRETLFNILSGDVAGSSFLDICAGSGAVSIEAISRGAARATMIEISRRTCAVIEENLKSLGISSKSLVINSDALAALKRIEASGRRFDIIFFDPPYGSDLYSKVMAFLGSRDVVEPGGIIIVEHRAKMPPEDVDGLHLYRRLKQGESALAFYERSQKPEARSQKPEGGC